MGEWATKLQARDNGSVPPAVTEIRWSQLLDDAAGFLATWGAQSVAMGWTALDLFAVSPGPERWLRSGLVALLRGRRVVAITTDAITISNEKRDPHRYRRNPNPGAVMLWDADALNQGA